MTDCLICCESYNMSNRKRVDCGYCNAGTCRSCVQRYILDTSLDPHCMSCKKPWDRAFLDRHCTSIFVNKDLKNHRENILFEREQCLLPETQKDVVKIKAIEKIRTENALLEGEIQKLRTSINRNEERIRMLDRVGSAALTEHRKFVRKCPVEKCRGFLSTQWKCDICENHICPKCNEVKGPQEHECDPANVETVNLLRKDTKACPSCGEMIFKISGCPQMWCPSCHVAFNWNTLQIETGVIHNPHYFEFQRRGGVGMNRAAGDIPCGGRPHVREIMAYIRCHPSNTRENDDFVCNMYSSVCHAEQWILRHEYAHMVVDNNDIRILYLMDKMSKEGFKHEIQKREKKFKKTSEIRDVIQMFVHTSDDLFRQMLVNDTYQEVVETLKNLKGYMNDSLKHISKRYNCVVPYLGNTRNIFVKGRANDID